MEFVNEAVPKSKKLPKFLLDDGNGEERVILSGIHDYYELEELVGKILLAITNLPPRKMSGNFTYERSLCRLSHKFKITQILDF